MCSIILINKGNTLSSFIFCSQHINGNLDYQFLLMGYFLKKKSIKQLNGDVNEDAKVIKFKTSFRSSPNCGKLPVVQNNWGIVYFI